MNPHGRERGQGVLGALYGVLVVPDDTPVVAVVARHSSVRVHHYSVTHSPPRKRRQLCTEYTGEEKAWFVMQDRGRGGGAAHSFSGTLPKVVSHAGIISVDASKWDGTWLCPSRRPG